MESQDVDRRQNNSCQSKTPPVASGQLGQLRAGSEQEVSFGSDVGNDGYEVVGRGGLHVQLGVEGGQQKQQPQQDQMAEAGGQALPVEQRGDVRSDGQHARVGVGAGPREHVQQAVGQQQVRIQRGQRAREGRGRVVRVPAVCEDGVGVLHCWWQGGRVAGW